MLEVCHLAGSDCLVAPCCNGKMHQHYLEDGGGSGEGLEGLEGPGKDLEGPPGASYPRSQLFSSLLSQEQYWRMSRAADDENHYPAKCLVGRGSGSP